MPFAIWRRLPNLSKFLVLIPLPTILLQRAINLAIGFWQLAFSQSYFFAVI